MGIHYTIFSFSKCLIFFLINKKRNSKITKVGNLMGQTEHIFRRKGLRRALPTPLLPPPWGCLGGAMAHETFATRVAQVGKFSGSGECHRAQCMGTQCTDGVGLFTPGEGTDHNWCCRAGNIAGHHWGGQPLRRPPPPGSARGLSTEALGHPAWRWVGARGTRAGSFGMLC